MTSREEMWRKAVEGDFLEAPAAAFAAPYIATGSDASGTVIGRYQLIEVIGRGGMGTVWLAERADGQFEQRVALKLIRRGMDSDEVLARFRRERQILARLDHQHIARLLDGGVSEDGRPYFVMEHVRGAPITQYCDEHALDTHARLALMVTVCRAVQYAHRSLIIHRDVKPSNVLVTDAGEVKLLDFGVAKLLDETDGDAVTNIGKAMTPQYAAPEQLAGTAITTATDTFQLGILLYELVTGQRPWSGSNVASRQEDPPWPSQHRQSLRGDVDAIALRALQQESDRRFPSAEAMAEEIERHLAHLPIQSRTAGPRYRAAKFVRRNRGRVAAVSALLIASVLFVLVSMLQVRSGRDRAERETAKLGQSAAMLRRFFQGWSPDAADRGQVSAVAVLGDAVRRADRELSNDPEMLGVTLSALGDFYTALGRAATADTVLSRALAIQERLYPQPSGDLAATLARQGRMLVRRGDLLGGEKVLRRALAMYRAVLPPSRIEVLQTEYELADALVPQEKLAESEDLLRDALAHSPTEDAPITTEFASELGYVLVRRARYPEAVAALSATLDRQKRLFGPRYPATLRTMRFLAAALRSREDLPRAEALDREALAAARALYGPDHIETATQMYSFAILLERKGDFAEAEQLTREVLRIGRLNFPAANVYDAQQLRTLGALRLAQGDLREANSVLRRSLAEFHAADPSGHPDEADVRNRLAYIAFNLPTNDSLQVYHDAVAFDNSRRVDEPFFTTDGYEYLAWSARRMRDAPLAAKLYQRAATLYETELPLGHPYRVMAMDGMKH